ncbi:stereocilin [Emydura macquarii macquarii]|uniref:stereocilin n=1 Tax=Emydura macquarii macquarii TaxID=1129001 RepID=UPI00352B86F8
MEQAGFVRGHRHPAEISQAAAGTGLRLQAQHEGLSEPTPSTVASAAPLTLGQENDIGCAQGGERIAGGAPEGHRVPLRDLISWRRSGGSAPSSPRAGLRRQEVGLESLGSLPTVGSSPLQALWQSRSSRRRISGFLYNISMHLENQELPELGGKPWGSLLQHLLSQAEKSPPVPVLHLRDVLFSLRGSRDWDTLLSLLHSLLSLFSRDQTLLHFLQQNWERLSSLGEALAQALLAGVLGQGGPGLPGTFCSVTGRRNCSSSTDWTSQLMKLFADTGWKPMARLQSAGSALAHGRVKPFHTPPGAFQELNLNASSLSPGPSPADTLSLLQISRQGTGMNAAPDSGEGSEDTLWGALEEVKQRFLRRMGRSLYTGFRRKVSRMTGLLLDQVSVALGIPHPDEDGKCSVGTLQQLLLWGIRHNISWNARMLGFRSGTVPSPPPTLRCIQPAREPHRPGEEPLQVTKRASGDAGGEPWLSAEVLEAVCNDTIPSLPGISNFTVYLYCSLFNGSDNSSQPPSKLGDLCSDSARYLSSTSKDSMWVRACRAHVPEQFNTTGCSNTSLLQLPSLLEELCANLSRRPKRSRCLEVLHGAPWRQQDFWSCFLEKQTFWSGWLCSKESLWAVPAEGRAWISKLCHSHRLQTKALNASLLGSFDPCDFRAWSPQRLGNLSLLEQCRGANPNSFQELVCENSSLLESLVSSHPWVMDHCLASLRNGRCLLLRLLDILPLSSHLDASRLCRDPASYLLGLASQFTHCEEETASWILSLNYLLRLLDFTLTSSELDEVGQAAREQLSEAILLSSLLDNNSFWASLQVNSSLSILQAVGRYLEQEHDVSLRKELLHCFSPVLWDLIQREEGTPALDVLVQEYLQMPQENFQQLLLSAESKAVRRFLSLLHRSWHRLQVATWDGQALQALSSRLMGRFPQLTPQLFVDLSQFMPVMAVSDIMRVPPALLANESVLAALRSHSARMTRVQKSTFAKLLLQAQFLGDVATWPQAFLRATQPLLPHLPLRRFVQLTPQQIQGLADGWQDIQLGLARGRHLAHSLMDMSPGAGVEQVHRLGGLACYLSPEELQALAPLSDPWGPVEQSLLACAAGGVLRLHGRVAYALAELLRSASLAAVGPQELHAWRGIIPELGVRFLQRLSAPQLRALLPELKAAHLTPAQVSVLLTQAVQTENVTEGVVSRLCPLMPGLGPESLQAITWPILAQACECLAPALPLLSAPQKAVLLQAVQRLSREQQARTIWPDCLLPFVPLKILPLDAATLLGESGRFRELPWSQQQAQFLWRKVEAGTNVTQDTVRVKLVDKLPNDSVRLILDHVSSRPWSLLELPPHRRAALAHRALRLLRAPGEAEIPGQILDLLGPLLGFLGPEAAAQIQPASLLLHLEELQAACLAEEFAEELGRLLLTERVLGPPQRWSLLDLQQLGRLVFLLPVEGIQQIPRRLCPGPRSARRAPHGPRTAPTRLPAGVSQELRSRDTLEQLLQSQRDWERSELGRLCQPPGTQARLRRRKQALVAWLVRSSPAGGPDPVPSCADMRATFPAAWSAAQIASMAPSHFEGCLALISQDPALVPGQLHAALGKAKQLFGAARPMQPVHTLQLGLLATQLSEQELQELALSDWGALAVLGGLEGWTAKQMRAVVSSFLHQSGTSVQGLALPELAALGHLLCGLRAEELQMLNSQEFSQAAPFVGSLTLGCSERQMEALAELLMSSSAFGPVSSWEPEIFTEIGTLAAGLQDIALSSLVPEQIWALTPLAIAAIPAPKFTVVFSPAQLLGFTSAQASAVTPQQQARLSAEQRQAVASAQLEGEVAQDGRGESPAPPSNGCSAGSLLALQRSASLAQAVHPLRVTAPALGCWLCGGVQPADPGTAGPGVCPGIHLLTQTWAPTLSLAGRSRARPRPGPSALALLCLLYSFS